MDRKSSKGGVKIGSNAAEKSKGLFSADDWQCGKCGNVNWSRRSTCNVCNGPQFSVEEERTGLGGGFDERGTVEYKEREESDDEYDDLGRKKRKKLPYKRPPPPPVADMPDDDEEDEESEEEDDDDGDLSKYDLWGDDDKTDAKKPDAKEDKNGKKEEAKPRAEVVKRKQSRSRSASRRSRSKDKKRSRRSRSSRLTLTRP